MKRCLCFLLVLTVSPFAWSESITIVTWNIGRDPISAAEYRDFFETIEPELILLQEIRDKQEVLDLLSHSTHDDWHVALSLFDTRRGKEEVAIASRAPLERVIEFDPFTDESEPDVEEVPLAPLLKFGIEPVGTQRGFLWAHIPNWRLTVCAVHMKSSVGRTGEDDASNAVKRELVAAGIAQSVVQDIYLFDPEEYAFVVGGDFNVGHADARKNGVDLKEDCYENCRNRDGYDETHALLRGGLIYGLRMVNLSEQMMTSTFPSYPGTPIDVIYVSGDSLQRFSPAQKPANDVTFGSDHTPVWTEFRLNAN